MIVLAMRNEKAGKDLHAQMQAHGFNRPVKILDWQSPDVFAALYAADTSCVVTDYFWDQLPRGLSVDMLNAISHRVPVVVWGAQSESTTSADLRSSPKKHHKSGRISEFESRITLIESGKISELVETLALIGQDQA